MPPLTLSTLLTDILNYFPTFLAPNDQQHLALTSKLFQQLVCTIYWKAYKATPELRRYTSEAEKLFNAGNPVVNRVKWVYQQVVAETTSIASPKIRQAIHPDAAYLAQICQAIAISKFLFAISLDDENGKAFARNFLNTHLVCWQTSVFNSASQFQ